MSQSPVPPSHSDHPREVLWNFLTALIVVALIGVFIIVALIYVNPRSALNPFPPPTAIPTLAAATQAPPPATPQPATNTPPVSQATRANTPVPPDQPTPTAILATPASTSGSASPTPTLRANSSFAFIPQTDPKPFDASIFSPGRSCQWMGVAGKVVDIRDSPVPLGIQIQLAGILDGKPILLTSLTGTAILYGPSGFEFTLAEKPIASKSSLWVRLLDQAGLALSDRIYFDTYADCTKNLIIINFRQVR